MAVELGEAAIPIRATLDKLDGDLASARGKVNGAISGIVGGVQKIGGAAMAGIGIVSGAAAVAGAALGKIAIDAAPVQGIRDAFEGIAESSGSSMDEMLGALQRGSSGMISQRDLMGTYNKAAQLVGTTFANELPDAMGYLSKVSAATGQDMGFMLDSLVTGVGRLSPMILDNLGIQVSLSEATERAADMFGVQASELDKTQIQAGMMNVVLEKLAANTAAMPDVTDTAAAKMAKMKATIQDTKDQIGIAFLPILSTLMDTLGQLAERFLPVVIQALEWLAPIIQNVVEQIGFFLLAIAEGEDPLEMLKELLYNLFPEELAATILGIIEGIGNFIATAQEALAPVMQWISDNVELKDVLIALGIAIGAVVVPALLGIVAAALPVIAAGAALIAAVGLVRKAWESDFLGIRTFVQNSLAAIKAWWDEHGAQVIAAATQAYETVKTGIETAITFVSNLISTVLAAIQAWWGEHGAQVIALAQTAYETVKTGIETAVTTVQTIISTVLAAIQGFWDAHGATVISLVETAFNTIRTIIDTIMGIIQGIISAITAAIHGDWYAFGESLRDVWDSIWEGIKAIVQNAWGALVTIVEGIISAIKSAFTGVDWGSVGRSLIDGIVNGIKAGVGALVDAVKSAAQAALDAAKGFLGIDSPSKAFAVQVAAPSIKGWVQGLKKGITRVRLAGEELAQASMVRADSEGTGPLVPQYNLTIHTSAPAESALSDYDLMVALGG